MISAQTLSRLSRGKTGTHFSGSCSGAAFNLTVQIVRPNLVRSAGEVVAPCSIGARTTMRRSNDRILTTHTGSLPRPPGLTRLYARRSRGEPVDAAEIEQAGHAALLGIVPKQIEA